jgi:hypothetical protein
MFTAFILAGLGAGSCGTDPTCIVVSADCAPLYEPSFDNVYSRTLSQGCAASGSSCHSSEGAKAGLNFSSADQSYALLLGEDDGIARVSAGDAGCSILVQRLESNSDPMPPGQPLSEAERCAIIQWIDQGAKR